MRLLESMLTCGNFSSGFTLKSYKVFFVIIKNIAYQQGALQLEIE
jgi:hypothetical protein